MNILKPGRIDFWSDDAHEVGSKASKINGRICRLQQILIKCKCSKWHISENAKNRRLEISAMLDYNPIFQVILVSCLASVSKKSTRLTNTKKYDLSKKCSSYSMKTSVFGLETTFYLLIVSKLISLPFQRCIFVLIKHLKWLSYVKIKQSAFFTINASFLLHFLTFSLRISVMNKLRALKIWIFLS